jgi:hypothetical protein
MIWNVAYVVGSAVGSGGAARPGAEGVVSVLVQPLTTAPDLDGWAITGRLLTDLAPLNNRLWLALDDVHEFGPDALRQLKLLIMLVPPGLRFVLATRHDGAGLLCAGRPAVGGVRSRWLSHGPSASVGRSANIPAGRDASRLPRESRQLESAQNTGQLQTDIVAPGAFMVQIRRPATDADQQQKRSRNQ